MNCCSTVPNQTGVYTVLGRRFGKTLSYKRIYRKETGWILSDFEVIVSWSK